MKNKIAELETMALENKRLKRQVEIAVETLKNIKSDFENCDWSCGQCLHDPEMMDSDINYLVKESLTSIEEAKYL